MSRTRWILYVDDDADIREIATMALELDPELRVVKAETGAAVLALLDSGDFLPDLILLDVMMAGIDGPALARLLRQRPHLTRVPIAFMTARARDVDVAGYLEQGAVGVIVKPFDPMRLAAEVRGLIDGAAAGRA